MSFIKNKQFTKKWSKNSGRGKVVVEKNNNFLQIAFYIFF